MAAKVVRRHVNADSACKRASAAVADRRSVAPQIRGVANCFRHVRLAARELFQDGFGNAGARAGAGRAVADLLAVIGGAELPRFGTPGCRRTLPPPRAS